MIEWAIDLWPYVNGKALMSGLKLREMEASDMVDVLHFLFEEDMVATSPEMLEARSEMRVAIYKSMYDREYKYKIAKKDRNVKGNPATQRRYTDRAMDDTYVNDDLDNLASEQPFEPRMAPPKPYTPPTTPDLDSANPYPGLDSPLG